MAWITLLLAGLFEIGFTTSMRYTAGFTKPLPTAIFLVFASLSFYLLTKAAETIPLGTSYAVWTGIGAAGTVLIGIFWFAEPASALRLLFLATLIGSIIGLKVLG
ncbi:MAG: multidrug efflux SMR transporter [Hyphomicrobiaceae bacterium]